MKSIIYCLSLLYFLFFFSCQSGQEANGHDEHAAEERNESPSIVTFSRAQIEAIDLRLVSIEQKSLSDVLKVNGELRVPNQNKAKVTTLYPGIVKEIFVQPGSFVKKGQRIASITNADYVKMQEDFLNLSTQSALAETEFERQKELYAGNAGALKNLQRAESEFKGFATRKASLKQQLEMMGVNTSRIANGSLLTSLSVTAPVGGVLSAILVQIGSYVDASNPLAEIVDNRKIHVDLHVYEKDINRFKTGQDLDFYLTNNPEEKHSARVFSTGSSFEDHSKTIIVHAEVTCDKRDLIDGMNITAHVGFDQSLVDAVPSDAVLSHDGQDFIFVLLEEELDSSTGTSGNADNLESSFKKIPVIVGKTDIGFTQITPLEMLPKDAKVVSKGAFFVMAKFTNTGEDDHH